MATETIEMNKKALHEIFKPVESGVSLGTKSPPPTDFIKMEVVFRCLGNGVEELCSRYGPGPSGNCGFIHEKTCLWKES